eukprot:PITA_27822
MDQAKEQIKTPYKDRVAKYGPIWAIIDERWNNQFHRHIHATRYFLNPRYHYKALEAGALGGEVRDGLIDCIDRMIPLESDQLEIHRQVTCFSKDIGTFGKNLAKIAREADEPDPLVPTLGSVPSPSVAGASFAQPRRKRISCLSQRATVAQPASAPISTIAVGDDDEEEPWVSLSDSNSESEPDDVGSSSCR